MANFTISSLTSDQEAVGSSVDINDFPPGALPGEFRFLLVTPNNGYTVNAVDFFVNDYNPALTFAIHLDGSNSLTATTTPENFSYREFQQGVNVSNLPFCVNKVKIMNTTTGGTLGNAVKLELTLTGTFPNAENTIASIPILGQARPVSNSISFYDAYDSAFFATSSGQTVYDSSGSNTNGPAMWTNVESNSSCATCVTSTTSTATQSSGIVWNKNTHTFLAPLGTQQLIYTRTFTCHDGLIFSSGINYEIVANDISSYSVVETVLATNDWTGQPSSIKYDVYYTNTGNTGSIGLDDHIFWQSRAVKPYSTARIASPEITNCYWGDTSDLLDYPVLRPQSQTTLNVFASMNAIFDIRVNNVSDGTTYDFTTGYFTKEATKYTGESPTAPLGLLSRTINLPLVRGIPDTLQVELIPREDTLGCDACNSCRYLSVNPDVTVTFSGVAHNPAALSATRGTYSLSASDLNVTDLEAGKRIDEYYPIGSSTVTPYTTNITHSWTGTTQAGTTGTTIKVPAGNTAAIGLGSPITGAGVAGGTIVSALPDGETITTNQAHGIGAGVSITTANLIGIKRQPVSEDWVYNRTESFKVLARLGVAGTQPIQVLTDLPATDVSNFLAGQNTHFFGAGLPPYTTADAPATSGDYLILKPIYNGYNTNAVTNFDLKTGDYAMVSNSRGGRAIFNNPSATQASLTQTIAFSMDVGIELSPIEDHTLYLDPEGFCGPIKTPKIAAVSSELTAGGTAEFRPGDYIDPTDPDNTVFGTGSYTISNVAVGGIGGAVSIEGDRIIYNNTSGKGAAAGVASVTYRLTDSYGNITNGLQWNITVSAT